MDEADPDGAPLGELERVGAAEREVAGVEADRHGRLVEEPVELVGGLDQRVDVRVDDLTQTVAGTMPSISSITANMRSHCASASGGRSSRRDR